MGASPSLGASHWSLIVERDGSNAIGLYFIFPGGFGFCGIFPVVIMPYIIESGSTLNDPHTINGA